MCPPGVWCKDGYAEKCFESLAKLFDGSNTKINEKLKYIVAMMNSETIKFNESESDKPKKDVVNNDNNWINIETFNFLNAYRSIADTSSGGRQNNFTAGREVPSAASVVQSSFSNSALSGGLTYSSGVNKSGVATEFTPQRGSDYNFSPGVTPDRGKQLDGDGTTVQKVTRSYLIDKGNEYWHGGAQDKTKSYFSGLMGMKKDPCQVWYCNKDPKNDDYKLGWFSNVETGNVDIFALAREFVDTVMEEYKGSDKCTKIFKNNESFFFEYDKTCDVTSEQFDKKYKDILSLYIVDLIFAYSKDAENKFSAVKSGSDGEWKDYAKLDNSLLTSIRSDSTSEFLKKIKEFVSDWYLKEKNLKKKFINLTYKEKCLLGSDGSKLFDTYVCSVFNAYSVIVVGDTCEERRRLFYDKYTNKDDVISEFYP